MDIRHCLAGLMCCIAISLPARANVGEGVVAHYWFDQSGQVGTLSCGRTEIDVSGLSDGLHTLYVRIDSDDIPSALSSRCFMKCGRLRPGEKYTSRVMIDNSVVSDDEHCHSDAGDLISFDLDLRYLADGIHRLTIMVSDKYGLIDNREGFFLKVPTADQYADLRPCYMLDGRRIAVPEAMLGDTGAYSVELDMSAVPSGLHSLTAYMVSPSGLMTSASTAWFLKVPLGGEGIRQYRYWVNDDMDSARIVELETAASPFSLVDLVDVNEYDIRSRCYGFYLDDGVATVCARNEFHFMGLDGDCNMVSSDCLYDDCRVTRVVEDINHLESNSVTRISCIADNEIRWYRFEGHPGDSIGLTFSSGAMFELYGPSGQTLMKKSGDDVVMYNSAVLCEAGSYYLAVHDLVQSSVVDVDFVHIVGLAGMGDAVSGESLSEGMDPDDCYDVSGRRVDPSKVRNAIVVSGGRKLFVK